MVLVKGALLRTTIFFTLKNINNIIFFSPRINITILYAGKIFTSFPGRYELTNFNFVDLDFPGGKGGRGGEGGRGTN
jgi:hypothetical protein